MICKINKEPELHLLMRYYEWTKVVRVCLWDHPYESIWYAMGETADEPLQPMFAHTVGKYIQFLKNGDKAVTFDGIMELRNGD